MLMICSVHDTCVVHGLPAPIILADLLLMGAPHFMWLLESAKSLQGIFATAELCRPC